MKYNNIQWVVQRNLVSENILSEVKEACERINVDYIEVDIIPFTNELPYFPTSKRSIFYGSITFNNLVYKNDSLKEGLFFNENFNIENYLNKWKEHMLNFDSVLTTFKDLQNFNYGFNQPIFIRPNEDDKSFSGEVKEFGEVKTWYEHIKTLNDNPNLDLNTKIIVGPPLHIKKEWRLWIVNKKVIASSLYRENFKLKKERGCPQPVIEFAEQRCLEYTPHDVFVMDIALCGDSYYIIECGCLNGAGLYMSDIDSIVKNITEYFRKIEEKSLSL